MVNMNTPIYISLCSFLALDGQLFSDVVNNGNWLLCRDFLCFRMKKEDGEVSINLDKKIHCNNADKMDKMVYSNEVVDKP